MAQGKIAEFEAGGANPLLLWAVRRSKRQILCASRRYNIGAHAVQSRSAVRYLIAIFADLQFSFAIRGANHESRFAYLFRGPLTAPETPGNFCTWLRDLRCFPRL